MNSIIVILVLMSVSLNAIPVVKQPRVGVACVVQHEGKVLLGKRKGAHGIGTWATPGGHLEFGETIESCAKRELLEETGLSALSFRMGPWVENLMQEEQKHYITVFVYIDSFEGEPALLEPNKCEGWEWFHWDNLPERLFSTISSFIEQEKKIAPTIEGAVVSALVLKSDSGKVMVEKNLGLSMVPSSCMKIVTTAAALHILGEEAHFETHLEYDGTIGPDQILLGNLYIRGEGDPCLGSDRIGGSLSWEKQIEAWADAIESLGIREIEGSLFGDSSKWERALAVPSWLWEDLGNYYGAGASALSFHENAYSLVFRPGAAVGDPATLLRIEPPLPITFHNEVKTGREGSGDCASVYGSEFSNIQFVRGTIPAGVEEFVIKGAIPDPAAASVHLLTQELERRGIKISNGEISFGKRTPFHKTISPTVREIVHETNQKSINLYAEHLLKKMGDGSTAGGVRAVKKFLKSQNIDLTGFQMFDGSGLSRKNLITTRQLIEILLKMKENPIFVGSLPEIRPGIRAKSGSMSSNKGYAGYAGNQIFAIIVNHSTDSKVLNEKLDQFLCSLKKGESLDVIRSRK